MAELTKETLLELGFDSLKVITIPGETNFRNRTWSSALTLKNWLSINKIPFNQVDVITVGCHAKRSQLLFKKALGKKYKVGV